MSTTTRRQLLKAVPMVAAGIFAGSGKGKAEPGTPVRANKLVAKASAAVLRAARDAGPLNLSSAAASLDLYFAYLDDAGFIADWENALNTSGLLGVPLSPDQILTLIEAIRLRTGIEIDPRWFDPIILPAIVAQLASGVSQDGVRGMNDLMARTLEQAARRGLPAEANRVVHSLDNWGFCSSIGVVGLYTSVWGYMLTVGALVIPGGEIFLAYAGIMEAIGGMYCL